MAMLSDRTSRDAAPSLRRNNDRHVRIADHARMWLREHKPDDAVIDSGLTVDEVMRFWPDTIRVFLAFGMQCVGCPIGIFHTVEAACVEHGVDLPTFLAALRSTPPADNSDMAQ